MRVLSYNEAAARAGIVRRSLERQIILVRVEHNARRASQANRFCRTFRPVDHRKPSPGWKGCAAGDRQCADAFAGALTRGSIRTFPATAETENTASYQGGAWLGDLDSNQD
jgi:hypothetical protein